MRDKRQITVERKRGRYWLVIKIPVRIELDEGALVLRKLPEVTPTFAERRVLELLCAGKVNKEIASALGVSVRTAKFHVANLLVKSGCKNRSELTMNYNGGKL